MTAERCLHLLRTGLWCRGCLLHILSKVT
jgi:hypothetical protein